MFGFYLEGFYLNVMKKGIYSVDFICFFDDMMIDMICVNSDVIVKVIFVLENNKFEYIEKLVKVGIVVFIGYINVIYSEVCKSFEFGIIFVIYFFNVMILMVGCELGVVGVIYDIFEVYVGIIVDGFYVDYVNIWIVYKIKGEKFVLVIDVIVFVGVEMDYFIFVGKKVYYWDGKCVDENGMFGGLVLIMIEVV